MSNVCVELDAGVADAGGTVYSALEDTSKWATFDMTTVNAAARGFRGTAFDGRYVYFVPDYNNGTNTDGLAARYDTQAAFTAGASWSMFDMTTVSPGANGFKGGAFDGRYVYYVPNNNNGTSDGTVARYDRQAPFTSLNSWAAFDTTMVEPGAKGFQGATFDGRYVYFVPFIDVGADGGDSIGIAARYDTQAPFATAPSWSTFDMNALSVPAEGFHGAVFDGRFVYYVPGNGSGGSYSGVVVRYDTQVAFGTMGSWSVFDMTTVNAAAVGYFGGSFDGRYVYFAPNKGGSSGLVMRYDTQSPFATSSSWLAFDLTMVSPAAKGFEGTAFDGRYVYFVPYDNGTSDGTVARYDTQASFAAPSSWSTFDITTVNAGAVGFVGAAFDGRYVYFVPNGGNGSGSHGIVARFDAKTPPALPPGREHGSFF